MCFGRGGRGGDGGEEEGEEGEEDSFPELEVGGMALCCPVCMGYEFACEDRDLLKRLEREADVSLRSMEVASLVRERLRRIERRRVELGYDVVSWDRGGGDGGGGGRRRRRG